MLTKLIIDILKQRPELRKQVADKLNKSIYTVNRYIESNEQYGELTRMGIVKFLSEETGLTQDQIINDTVEA